MARIPAIDIDKMIDAAIKRALIAGRQEVKRSEREAFQATERRLRALPDIRERVERNQEQLQLGPEAEARRSTDIIRFQRSGRRLSEEDYEKAWRQDLEATIAADQHEIKEMEAAMEPLTTDPYFQILEWKYFDGLDDTEIGSKLFCNDRTVRRNKSRLVRRLAIRLYGAEAL